jgi:hypothetical protein
MPESGRRIEVTQTNDGNALEFEVVVRDAKGQSRHQVTMGRMISKSLSGEHTPERVVEASFRFLLEREPKESILKRFDISAIAQYFPEFERELPRYL